MKKRILAGMLVAAMTASMCIGCGSKTETVAVKEETEAKQTEEETASEEEATEEAKSEEAPAEEEIQFADVEIKAATADEVKAFMNDTDEKTILVDARTQEAYSGWKMEGAKNGGHLKNAALYSARWFDCDISPMLPRAVCLERNMTDQNIVAGSEVIVYDYTGEQATKVAQYFVAQGVENVKVFQAKDMIDAGENLESYENYERFVPSELVKSVSDVKTGAATKLSAEAEAVFGSDVDKIVLVDVGYGNAKGSSYFSAGHVPGAVHINTDSYERPRVYIAEKRPNYASEWRLMSSEEFRDTVCPQYGITKDSVVILTSTGTAPIGRLGMLLRSLGVETYAMTGCLSAWTYNGYSLDTDESTLVIPKSVESFGSNEVPYPEEIVRIEEAAEIVAGKKDGQIVDLRDEAGRKGESTGYSYHDLAGHIPNDIWCMLASEETGDVFVNADSTPRTKEEMKDYFEKAGLDVNKTMAFYCGDSWGAAAASYWCQAVDLNNVKEYAEGWIGWSNEGYDFIDHNGNTIHYDRYRDTVVDANGNDMRDGVNFLDDEQ